MQTKMQDKKHYRDESGSYLKTVTFVDFEFIYLEPFENF